MPISTNSSLTAIPQFLKKLPIFFIPFHKADGIAQKNKVPVVPVFYDGTRQLWESNGYKIKPHEVVVSILPPIDTSEYTREDWKALPELTQRMISEALEEHRKNNR